MTCIVLDNNASYFLLQNYTPLVFSLLELLLLLWIFLTCNYNQIAIHNEVHLVSSMSPIFITSSTREAYMYFFWRAIYILKVPTPFSNLFFPPILLLILPPRYIVLVVHHLLQHLPDGQQIQWRNMEQHNLSSFGKLRRSLWPNDPEKF